MAKLLTLAAGFMSIVTSHFHEAQEALQQALHFQQAVPTRTAQQQQQQSSNRNVWTSGRRIDHLTVDIYSAQHE
eukprot:3489111-Pyramimonas_sp.AAC.1